MGLGVLGGSLLRDDDNGVGLKADDSEAIRATMQHLTNNVLIISLQSDQQHERQGVVGKGKLVRYEVKHCYRGGPFI